jgi:AmiR/NasT family two-component response regulator
MPHNRIYEPEVNQAAGMVSVQADCSIAEAFVLLQNRALVSGQQLHTVANDTVLRRVRFGPSA